MWVYQEVQERQALPEIPAEVPGETLSAENAVQISAEPEQQITAPVEPEAAKNPRGTISPKAEWPSRDCILMAAAYLFGTFLAGVAAVRCSAAETETFGYYLSCWQKLFSIGSAADAAGVFRAELLTVAGALMILLFLGLSALGPLPIFLFTMLYGTGSGLLSLQWATGREPAALLVLLFVCGVPTALAAGTVCVFGTSALQVSGRLCSSIFGQGRQAPCARELFGQFLRSLFLLFPLCGMAVGLLYLAGQGQFL